MSSSGGTDPLPDPGGIQAAVDRYRDLAKYLVALLAAVGATLVAGTQLSSIGGLSWAADAERVIAAAGGFLLAIGAVFWTATRALEVLRPIEMSLDDVAADAELNADICQRAGLLGGVGSVTQLKEMLGAPGQSPDQQEAWNEAARGVVGRATYMVATRRFARAWRGMLTGGLIGVLGIVAFAWGANAPEKATELDSPVEPSPIPVVIVPTDSGRHTLREVLGPRCARFPIRALVIAGTLGQPDVVTIPAGRCQPTRLVLSASVGRALPIYRGGR